MKYNWFKKAGWIYLPVSAMGCLLILLAIAFCVNVFWVIDRNSHSVSDSFYNVFPYLVCTFMLMNWIGGNTSSTKER